MLLATMAGFRPQLLVTTSARQTTTYSYDDLNRLVLTKYPDGFDETQTYDNIGNLASRRDPNGNTISYDYDGLSRLKTITYPDSSTASFDYDRNSNMIMASNSDGSATFSYDSLDRLTGETWTISGTPYSLSYGYDAVGNLVGIIYPDAKSVGYAVDPLDRVTSVKTGSTTMATLNYASNGAVRTLSYGNGVLTSHTHDKQARPSRIKIARGPTTLLDLNYGYDPAGNIATITGTNPTETYDHDYLDRLTYSSGDWPTLQYGYDPAGNRLWMQSGATTTTYTYGPYNQLVGFGATLAYSYDSNGNLKIKTSGSTVYTYSYDFENRLTEAMQGSSTLGTYTYSPLGDRIESVESGTTTTYINSGYDPLYEKSVSGSTTINDYVYLGSVLLAKLTGTSIYYFHQDHLGSTRLVTLGTSTSFSSNYQPFGPQYGAFGTDPGYKYTGRSSSSAIGLNYHGARWYDPSVGRFISHDPFPGRSSDPQSANPYVYVRNKPTALTDPNGLDYVAVWPKWEDPFGLPPILVQFGYMNPYAGLAIAGGYYAYWGGSMLIAALTAPPTSPTTPPPTSTPTPTTTPAPVTTPTTVPTIPSIPTRTISLSANPVWTRPPHDPPERRDPFPPGYTPEWQPRGVPDTKGPGSGVKLWTICGLPILLSLGLFVYGVVESAKVPPGQSQLLSPDALAGEAVLGGFGVACILALR